MKENKTYTNVQLKEKGFSLAINQSKN